MSLHDPWGIQIGGIHTPDLNAEPSLGCPEWPEKISLDHRDRVAEFLVRHGGSMDIANRSGQFESGCSGWSETYAADGYVLRVEWSRFELRGAMRAFELPPMHDAQM
jgi:hypothetical protein